MKYISLDLELNNPGESDPPLPRGVGPKIIQVGICIADTAQPASEWIVKSWLINPGEPIYPFITQLTGITDEMIQTQNHTHEEIALLIGSLIETHKPFVNPVTWGGGDSTELRDEMFERSIKFPYFGRRWIDVKTVFSYLRFAQGKEKVSGGLGSCMQAAGLRFEGEAHRADVDAFNTMRFWFHLLNRQQMFEAFKADIGSAKF